MSTNYAIVAPRHSGKTTLSNYLIDLHGYKRISFADPLKDIYVALFNMFLFRIGHDHEKFDRSTLEATKELHRTELERFGTVHGRSRDSSLWINLTKQNVRSLMQENPDVKLVCDDCRFWNEAEALRELGFSVVKLKRDEAVRMASIRQGMVDSWYAKNPSVHTDIDGEEGLELSAWVSEQMELTKTLPSEVEIDRITADLHLDNTTLSGLKAAAYIMNGDMSNVLAPHKKRDNVSDSRNNIAQGLHNTRP